MARVCGQCAWSFTEGDPPSCADTAAYAPALCTQAYQSTAGGSVLFVMPHCELELYDAVLAANWDAGRLSTIAILGNSFSDYVERNPSRTSKLGKHVCLIQACTQGAFGASLVQCPHFAP